MSFVARRRGRGSYKNVVVIADGDEPEEINRADDHGLPEADLTEEERQEVVNRMVDQLDAAERQASD
jgi:hypothetical protein